MTREKLTETIGAIVLCGHLLLVLVVVFSPTYGVEFKDAMSLLTVTAPIMSAYAISAVRYFFRPPSKTTALEKVRVASVVIGIAIPVLLILTLTLVYLAYALDLWAMTLESTRTTICVLESLFGVMLGIIVESTLGTKVAVTKRK